MPTYDFIVKGTSGDGIQTWSAQGGVQTESPGDFLKVPGGALEQAFMQLTQGRAQYGKPGVFCRGPYQITEMTIRRIEP